MKKVVLLAFMALCISSYSFSQEAENKSESKSKSEAVAFSSRDGSLIKKEFHPLGKIKGVEFEVLLLTDVLTSQKVACLRLKTTHYSSASRSSDEYIGTLDADEIDACAKSLSHIKNNILTTTPNVYTECEYKSKDGVMLGAFWSSKNEWSAFIYTRSYTSRSAAFLDASNIDEMISKLTEAKSQISTLVK